MIHLYPCVRLKKLGAIAVVTLFLTSCTTPTAVTMPTSAPSAAFTPAPASTPAPTENTPPSRPTVVVTDPFIVAAQYLANGEFNVPAASAVGEPGFHEPFSATHPIPSRLDPTKGKRLIIALRDLSRPQQRCDGDDPRSGCATVDWSDDPSRPKAPRSGGFDNSITLQLASGSRTYYLTASEALADQPDKLDPAHQQSAVGGTAREWSVILADELATGSALKLHLTLTKIGAPNVRIAYEIRVQSAR